MRIIKSKKYIKKEAIWSLPGDSGLPSNVTEQEITENAGTPESDPISNQQGESEIEVNWPEFSAWFAEGGEPLPDQLGTRNQPSTVKLIYTYNYTSGQAGDISPIQLVDYATKQTLTDPYLMSSFVDYYDEKIKSDIGTGEEDAGIGRSPDDIPF